MSFRFPRAAFRPQAAAPVLTLATIAVAGEVLAQGPVLRRHADGRLTVDAGGRALTGWPVGHQANAAAARNVAAQAALFRVF
jgi:hypothetical protein